MGGLGEPIHFDVAPLAAVTMLELHLPVAVWSPGELAHLQHRRCSPWPQPKSSVHAVHPSVLHLATLPRTCPSKRAKLPTRHSFCISTWCTCQGKERWESSIAQNQGRPSRIRACPSMGAYLIKAASQAHSMRCLGEQEQSSSSRQRGKEGGRTMTIRGSNPKENASCFKGCVFCHVQRVTLH